MGTYSITYTPSGLLVNDQLFREPVLSIIPKTIINEDVLEIHSEDLRLGIILTDTVTVAGAAGAGTLPALKAQIEHIIPTLAELHDAYKAVTVGTYANLQTYITQNPTALAIISVLADEFGNNGEEGVYLFRKGKLGELFLL